MIEFHAGISAENRIARLYKRRNHRANDVKAKYREKKHTE